MFKKIVSVALTATFLITVLASCSQQVTLEKPFVPERLEVKVVSDEISALGLKVPETLCMVIEDGNCSDGMFSARVLQGVINQSETRVYIAPSSFFVDGTDIEQVRVTGVIRTCLKASLFKSFLRFVLERRQPVCVLNAENPIKILRF